MKHNELRKRAIKNSSKKQINWDTMETADCVCPECKKTYRKLLDISYIVNLDTLRYEGYIILTCKKCKKLMEVN